MTLAIQGQITRDPGPMTLAIRWPHDPGENVDPWPHEPGDRHQRTRGPGSLVPSRAAIIPASRSCTYRRSLPFAASFAIFGRLAFRSACHWAVVARYLSPPPRVAALRRSSRETVDGERLSRRAISRTPRRCERKIAITSRSENDRKRPESGARLNGGIPPVSRNHLVPTGCETPAANAASSLDSPPRMASQNRCRCSRRPAVGRPGERIGARPARADRRRFGVPIATPPCRDVATTD